MRLPSSACKVGHAHAERGGRSGQDVDSRLLPEGKVTAPAANRVVRIAVVGIPLNVYAHLEEGIDADDVLRLGLAGESRRRSCRGDPALP